MPGQAFPEQKPQPDVVFPLQRSRPQQEFWFSPFHLDFFDPDVFLLFIELIEYFFIYKYPLSSLVVLVC
ncbi:MAG: hypothetical protein D3911_14045 [Candidatus Electrothrix sp. AW3_4]|nr:hypothetical protein [Candidatus Electrothrix gigas]